MNLSVGALPPSFFISTYSDKMAVKTVLSCLGTVDRSFANAHVCKIDGRGMWELGDRVPRRGMIGRTQ